MARVVMLDLLEGVLSEFADAQRIVDFDDIDDRFLGARCEYVRTRDRETAKARRGRWDAQIHKARAVGADPTPIAIQIVICPKCGMNAELRAGCKRLTLHRCELQK